MTDRAGKPSSEHRRAAEAAEFERKATPWPPFDLAAFARDADQTLRGETEAPPEALPATLQKQMVESAVRARLLHAQLKKGALSREEASHALRSELAGLEAEALRTDVASIASLVAALREAVDELGGIAHVAPSSLDVIVLADDGEARGRVALAAAALGYGVQAASSVVELGRLSAMAPPHVVLVGSSHVGRGGARELFPLLREASCREDVRILIFTDAVGIRTKDALRAAGIECAFSATHDVEVIMDQLAELLGDAIG